MAKILLVDDDAQSLYLLQRLMEGAGHETITAPNGAAALEIARKTNPDMVISDILMPVMDGFSLCREWKTDAALKTKPFIFYTATYTDERDRELAISMGVDRFIIKPADAGEFAGIVREVIEEHKAGRLKPAEPRESIEENYLMEYSHVIVRKLEKKLEELKKKNQELEREAAERKKAEEKLREALQERETLIREIFHRTKNNMQVILSFINLHSRHIKDPKTLGTIKEIKNRILSMALVHEKLQKNKSLSKIDLKDYILDLTKDLLAGYGADNEKIHLKLDLDSASVLIETAMPCGLIIHELMSNALKYAFPNGSQGEISIALHVEGGDETELCFRDNGVGLPEGLSFKEPGTLGFQIIKGLAEKQLKGHIEIKRGGGTEFKIRFREQHYRERI